MLSLCSWLLLSCIIGTWFSHAAPTHHRTFLTSCTRTLSRWPKQRATCFSAVNPLNGQAKCILLCEPKQEPSWTVRILRQPLPTSPKMLFTGTCEHLPTRICSGSVLAPSVACPENQIGGFTLAQLPLYSVYFIPCSGLWEKQCSEKWLGSKSKSIQMNASRTDTSTPFPRHITGNFAIVIVKRSKNLISKWLRPEVLQISDRQGVS